MAKIEEKNEKVENSTPKKKKSVKKANMNSQEHSQNTEPKEEAVKQEEKVYPEYHIANVGDTPVNLARMYDTTREEIANLNPDVKWLYLKAGTKIRVK